jgi:hypothetical protein
MIVLESQSSVIRFIYLGECDLVFLAQDIYTASQYTYASIGHIWQIEVQIWSYIFLLAPNSFRNFTKKL